MTSTAIEWTDAVWNPVRGCTRVSEGCRNCYAERQAIRQAGPGRGYEGLVESTRSGPRWTGVVRAVPELLREPLSWRRPRRVFVNSMSDLFHEGLPDEEIDRVFAVMACSPRHVFQVLTKRPERARDYLLSRSRSASFWKARALEVGHSLEFEGLSLVRFPLPNVWLGVSVEDQATADQRIQILLKTPATVRWISAEPLLGPIDLSAIESEVWSHEPQSMRRTGVLGDASYYVVEERRVSRGLDWVVVGGESGPRARACRLDWIRQIVGLARERGVPVFVKQLGAVPFGNADDSDWPRGWPSDAEVLLGSPAPAHETYLLRSKKGGDPAEWPEDLRVREYPRSAP